MTMRFATTAAVLVATGLASMGCGQPLAGTQTSPSAASSATESPSASPSPSPTPPPIGDVCLVGRWIDQRSVNQTGWTFNGKVVPVAGLAGFVLTLSADGTETADWSKSQPLIGTYQGQQLKIVVRGVYTFHGATADGYHVVVPAGTGTFSAQFFLGGKRESTYSAKVTSGETDAYVCGTTSLQTSVQVGSHVNTDSYVRG